MPCQEETTGLDPQAEFKLEYVLSCWHPSPSNCCTIIPCSSLHRLTQNPASLVRISILYSATQKSVFNINMAQTIFLFATEQISQHSLCNEARTEPVLPKIIKLYTPIGITCLLLGNTECVCFSTSQRKDKCSATLSRSLLLERVGLHFPSYPPFNF